MLAISAIEDRAGRATSPASGCSCALSARWSRVDTAFPDFDENLREAFREETELFVDSKLREDRSVRGAAERELHLRQRTAGAPLRIPNVYGSHFRRVTFDDDERRGGLLGQGSS